MLTIVKENIEFCSEENVKNGLSVVGIGSKGSEIEIVKSIISELPEDSGMAYLLFETLDYPKTESLRELLAAHAKIPVIEIINEIMLLPNQIYIVPENNFVTAQNGSLHLKLKDRSCTGHNFLDLFFASIANVYQRYAIGVLVSGTPLDGLAGLKTIKESGGTVLSVVHKKGMIQNRDTKNCIDFFIPPHSTADKLQEIQKSYFASCAHDSDDENFSTEELQSFSEIIAVIKANTGTDFTHYKPAFLRRGIAIRMAVTRKENMKAYLAVVKNSTSEQNALFDDLFIKTSYFLRDIEYFEDLSISVFPSLIENQKEDQIRIWSAGCCTGEEAYSLAMCLNQYLEQTNNLHLNVQILATDLSESSIEKARDGIYTAQDVKYIDKALLEKYFTEEEGAYRVNAAVRDICVFAVHDLTKDAPFAKIDFISCRNVLTYFNTSLCNQIIASFHHALREKGFLFLGKSETALNNNEQFNIIGRQEKIYSLKSSAASQKAPPLPTAKPDDVNTIVQDEKTEIDYKKIMKDFTFQYCPSAVLVNEKMDIIHFYGDTSSYFQPQSEKPSLNILHMADDELGPKLKNAIILSRTKNKKITGVYTVTKSRFAALFEVIYLPSYKDLSLIIFSELPLVSLRAIQGDEFEKELQINQESVFDTNEMKSSSEEVIKLKEELQSSNQELLSINKELQFRGKALSQSKYLFESVVKTMHETLLIMDQNALISSANASFYTFFKTSREETEGLTLFEIGNCSWNKLDFKESVLKKLTSQESIRNFKIRFNFADGTENIILLNASRISSNDQLIVITFEDITELERSKEYIVRKNKEIVDNKKHLEYFTGAASTNVLDRISKIYMFGKKILDTEKNITETGRYNLNRLLNSTENLNQLMEDLMEYSQINFTQKASKITDLNILVKKTIYELKNLIKEHRAQIHIDPLPSVSLISFHFRKLFAHLISNAIKHAQKEIIPKITIGSENPSKEELESINADLKSNYIKLIIRDNGSGFSAEYEKSIFEPFYKLHGNEKHYGSGLGLTIADKIVAAHKGFIKASSEPSIGTTISIYLPV